MLPIHQVRIQHPVGHGFFHSSTIRSLGKRFDYIVDCGGVRASVERQVRAFKDGREKRPIDLLVVSHFHADHVGGLDSLLSDVGVEAVAVPYLTPEERLVTLARMASEARADANERLLLDPVEWAKRRGAKAVYLVSGGALPDVESPNGPLQGQPRGQDPDNVQLDEWTLKPAHSMGTSETSEIPRMLPHLTPLEVRTPSRAIWSFNFFCYTNPELREIVIHSLERKKWAAIQEIRDAIEKERAEILLDSKARKSLKAWYTSIAKERLNLTSLCLLSLPAGDHGVCYYCAGQERSVLASSDWCWPTMWRDHSRIGWLGTGDAMLARGEISDAFLKRFERVGLKRVACTSLPHHGSRADYSGAVLDRINPIVTFVTCPARKGGPHPAPNVERAVLARGNPLIKVTEREASLLYEHIWVLVDDK